MVTAPATVSPPPVTPIVTAPFDLVTEIGVWRWLPPSAKHLSSKLDPAFEPPSAVLLTVMPQRSEPLVWNPIVLFATEALFRTTDPVVVIDPVTAKVEDMVTAPVIRAVPTTCNLALGTIPVPIPKLPDASTTKRSAPAVASYKVKGAFDIPVDPATNRHSLPDAPVLWNLIEDCSAPDPDTVSRCVPAEVPIPTFPVIETGRTIVMAPPVALVIV